MHLGVVIGRFQVAMLSSGHRKLIDHVFNAHPNVLVLVGSSQESCTLRNPLDYASRSRMIQQLYPQAVVQALPDCHNDEEWSQSVDSKINGLGWIIQEATLYGGRDSFRNHYKGQYLVSEVSLGQDHVNGTDYRRVLGQTVRDSQDFRHGVIYAIQNSKS